MALACLCSSRDQWLNCTHERCVAVQQQWKHFLEHDPSSSCEECRAFMEEIQAHVRGCGFGGSCPVVSVLRLPFVAVSQPEGRSPVSSGQYTPGNDSGYNRSGRSSASNLSAEQDCMEMPPIAVPNYVHPQVPDEMQSPSSDGTFYTPLSSFLMPTSVSSYNTAPSMPSPDPLSRQNSERPTSLHRNLSPIGEESSRPSGNPAYRGAQDDMSHPVQLLPDVEKSLNSINQLGHFGTTPLPSPFPAQEIVYPLNSGYLTCNPMDGEYHKLRDYIPQGEIGEGGQGTCFYGTDRILEKTFAYKENYRSADEAKLLDECAMMSRIHHDNVVVFLGAVREDESKVKLFMELAECGTVHQLFSDPQFQTDTPFIAHLLQQLLSAVNHLHQSNILHRDIKGKNLLLFDGCVCKLADFGMAVRVDDYRGIPDACLKGTYPFLSPEYMREQVYTFAADIWSAMAVAVEMMTGKDPWNAFNQDALVLIIGNYRARDHFHWLVPEQKLEQQVRESDQEGRELALWYFRAIIDMMKKVFVEEHVQRPTAHDLLCEDVMLQAPYIYDGEIEGEAPNYEGVPEPSTPCYQQPSLERDSEVGGSGSTELDNAGLHSGMLLQPRSVLHSNPEYQSIHSWPMTASDTMATAFLSSYPGPPCVVMTDHGVLIPGGRVINIVNKRRVSVPARCFQRAFSQQESMQSSSHHRDPPPGKRPVRRHSLAELYVMTGPEADHEP